MTPAKRLKKLKEKIDVVHTSGLGRRAKLIIGKTKGSNIPIGLMVRPSDQIFRGKHASMNTAREAGSLSWMIDSTLPQYLLDTYKIDYLLVFEKDAGDIWVSKIEDWFDDERLYRSPLGEMPTTDYRGFTLKYLPVQHWMHLPLPIDYSHGRQR